jgi:hypothetical protein
MVGPYTWSIWSNASGTCMTTYGAGAAFKATWNNSGDALARVGLQWDKTKTYDQLGTISADYSYIKSGSAGGYSYIGAYGWSVDPCVEFYVVDDSYSAMPINPGGTLKGTVVIDGATYKLYSRAMSGTGGSRCSGVTSWSQYYSVRQSGRQCGHMSLTQHFKAWAAAGMPLGKMLEGSLLTETGGGVGSINYTSASVTAK